MTIPCGRSGGRRAERNTSRTEPKPAPRSIPDQAFSDLSAGLGERGPEAVLPGRGDGRRADSIEDLNVLRRGATPELFGGIRAQSTLESFLRSLT
jgi:hypothetical protein